MNFMSPLTDISFKKLFGTGAHDAITIHFLNAVLKLPQDRLIEKIEIQLKKLQK